MVNSDDFASRLQKVMDYYDLSAAAFADSIEVGRSSISHIVSGRNKPSLDFVLKVIQTFPEVELYWLLNGKGNFPTVKNKPATTVENLVPSQTKMPLKVESEPVPKTYPSASAPNLDTTGKEISKIVIFYTDGSFEAFKN